MNLWRKSVVLCGTILAFMAAVCSSVSLANPDTWPQTVRIGLIPTEGGADIVKRFEPLIQHLEKTLGVKVEAQSASDYAGVITAMAHKHIDFAYLGPKSYVEASEKAGAVALAMEKDKSGEPTTASLSPRKAPALKNWRTPRGRSSPSPIPIPPRGTWCRTCFSTGT